MVMPAHTANKKKESSQVGGSFFIYYCLVKLKRADDIVILSWEAGNDADGLRLSRKRTIYMLKMGSKVSNRSFGRKDAHFRGFC